MKIRRKTNVPSPGTNEEVTETERQKAIHDLEYLIEVNHNNPEASEQYKKQLEELKKKSRHQK